MPSNTAAWLVQEGKPLQIKEAPYPDPGQHEIIVENRAVALNPVDCGYQKFGPAFFPWLTLPAIVGEDVAGQVVAVGSGVTSFKAGDRVTGLAASAFQKYSVLRDHVATVIPDSISYEQAAVLPLGLSTACLGLFHKDYLALELPSPESPPKRNGKSVLIWAGSTSVGSNAVQLASAAGYEVFTTCSPRNFDYVKKLGASHVFDYNSPTVKDDVVTAFSIKKSAGALAIGRVPATYDAIIEACIAAVTAADGPNFVALTMRPPENLPDNVRTNFVNANNLHQDMNMGYAIFGNYLTTALATGSFTPAPEAQVVGKGLEEIQAGMEKLLQGVSATKLVIIV